MDSEATAAGGAPGLTARLAAMVADDDPPMADAWRDLGERAFVDTVGVLLAGHTAPPVAAVADTVLAEQSDGPSRCVSTGTRMPARSAALVDGTSAHALDYDDVDDALLAHPSAVLVPTLVIAPSCASSRATPKSNCCQASWPATYSTRTRPAVGAASAGNARASSAQRRPSLM